MCVAKDNEVHSNADVIQGVQKPGEGVAVSDWHWHLVFIGSLCTTV